MGLGEALRYVLGALNGRMGKAGKENMKEGRLVGRYLKAHPSRSKYMDMYVYMRMWMWMWMRMCE